MAIPDYRAFMLPFLQAIADGQEHRIRDVTTALADELGISEEDRKVLLPSGQQTVAANRVGWARTYLKKAGLLQSPRRGVVTITPDGASVLQSPPAAIDIAFLKRYPSFVDFWEQKQRAAIETSTEVESGEESTPEEILEAAYGDLRNALADEILDQAKGCSPQFFERLVVELLVAMGYGGSLADAGRAVGRSGDGGIDGIINEDKLGLDVVCIQAKRWADSTVGRPIVQAFAGSMEGHRAKKGVLITTSSFSRDAHEYVRMIERKIVLIDGKRLAELMIDHGIGVTTMRSYDIKRIDSDYFAEDGE